MPKTLGTQVLMEFILGLQAIMSGLPEAQLRKNAHAPILISNPVFKKSYEIPWLNNMKLKYVWK